MGNSAMPFIAVIGGLWNLEPNDLTAAKETAKTIGEELAKAGFGLVVYFSDDASLEPHVVSGYVAALAQDAGEIRVRYAQSQRVKFAEETHGRAYSSRNCTRTMTGKRLSMDHLLKIKASMPCCF
jgi:hypothetical protein